MPSKILINGSGYILIDGGDFLLLGILPSVSPSISPSISPSFSPSPSPGWMDYTKGSYVVLPLDDSDLETTYLAQDIIDVADDDGTRVVQLATDEYAIHQFKNYVTGSYCSITWNGRTNILPSISIVKLQIYNYDLSQWDDLDANNTAEVDTDFNLSAASVNSASYKSPGNVMTCRVYQKAQ